jgi:hypothetical protein
LRQTTIAQGVEMLMHIFRGKDANILRGNGVFKGKHAYRDGDTDYISKRRTVIKIM